MAQINIFENFDNLHIVGNSSIPANTLQIQRVYIPGSLSFNVPSVVFTKGDSSDASFSVSLGLYSLTGNTLALANSASGSTNGISAILQWFSMATSTTQNISPGEWYLGFVYATSSRSNITFRGNIWPASPGAGASPTSFIRGRYTVSVTNIPASISTSDLLKELFSNTSTSATLLSSLVS